MKLNIILFLTIMITGLNARAQNEHSFIEKTKTLDKTIETLYGVISGDKGQERDWDLFRFLFHPEAKLIPSSKNESGLYQARYMKPEDYIVGSGKWLVENGFHEKEIHRVTNRFGNICQVFSTYEAFNSLKDTEPFMRGINSIQLLNDGNRWWIINIYWTQEGEGKPIPTEYLPND